MGFSDFFRGNRDHAHDEPRHTRHEWTSQDRQRQEPRRDERENLYGGRGSGNYDQFADRYAAQEPQRRAFNDRWQNSYSSRDDYADSSGYGGDYGERGGEDKASFSGGRRESAQYGQERETGQFRGRGPKGYRRSDTRIHEDVCECLMEDERIDASNVEVTVKDCEVTLSGTVNSRDEKRRAEGLIDQISGVRDVHNQLRVVNQGGRIEAAAQQAGAQQNQPTPSPSGDASLTDQSHRGPHH